MKWSIESKTAIGFGIAFVLVFTISGIAYRNTLQFIDTSKSVSHTLDVLEEIEITLSSITTAESEQRGYIITGDITYLNAYELAYTQTYEYLSILRQLTSDNPVQQTRLDTLAPIIEERFRYLEESIALRQENGFAAAQDTIESGLGRQQMTNVRTILMDMKTTENILLAQRNQDSENSAQSTRSTFTILTYSVLGLFLITYFVIRRDSNHRKAVERAVAYERDLLQTLMDNIPDNIYFKDTDSRFLRVNRAQAQFLGLASAEDAIGKTDADFQKADLAREFLDEERQLLAQGQSLVDRTEFNPDMDGNPRWFSATKVPIYNTAGQIRGMVGISRDITSRQIAEDEIKKLNESLKRRSADLLAANQELEAFSYSVSHDLRAPLRSIDGFSQALLEDYSDQIDSAGQSYLQRVRAATQRMGELIDDLLELSRVTRMQMRHDEVDLSKLAQQIADNLQKTSNHPDPEFVIAKDMKVTGDERLLRIALENLLGNAWKFSSQQPAARVEVGSILQPDGQTAYFVRDNGVGFEMAYVDKLFGAFQRLHAATEFPGTGIGLATVKRIISRHDGRIWAEGAINQGATFYFVL